MELWVRSQDKMALMKCTMFDLDNNQTGIYVYNDDNYMKMAGKYKSKERALEVLDEIQSKLKGTFLMKMKDEKYSKYIEDGKKYLEDLNGVCVVTGDGCFDLEPINKDIYVYEMPKE